MVDLSKDQINHFCRYHSLTTLIKDKTDYLCTCDQYKTLANLFILYLIQNLKDIKRWRTFGMVNQETGGTICTGRTDLNTFFFLFLLLSFFFVQYWGVNSVLARQALYHLKHSSSPLNTFFKLIPKCRSKFG
jgi:hypothetical protein